jgi:hypothetical protein
VHLLTKKKKKKNGKEKKSYLLYFVRENEQENETTQPNNVFLIFHTESFERKHLQTTSQKKRERNKITANHIHSLFIFIYSFIY